MTGDARAALAEVVERVLAPFEELFSGGPDTPCRTTWPSMLSEECVEVPMSDLRAAFERARRAALPDLAAASEGEWYDDARDVDSSHGESPAAASEGTGDREALADRLDAALMAVAGKYSPPLVADLIEAAANALPALRRPVTAVPTEGREDTKERLQAFLDAHPEAAAVAVPGVGLAEAIETVLAECEQRIAKSPDRVLEFWCKRLRAALAAAVTEGER